jgi:hypothetical protein
MLMDVLQQDISLAKKVLSFYNMVQVHKILHKQYLDGSKDASWMLNSFIPFYTDIELIGITGNHSFTRRKNAGPTLTTSSYGWKFANGCNGTH